MERTSSDETRRAATSVFDPLAALAASRHEFGEHGGVNMSIETSTAYTVMDSETMPAIFAGQRGPEQGGCYLYGRHFNPTVYALARDLAAMEDTEAAYCTASGMAASAGALLQLCDTGDEIVASHTLYGGTFALLREFLPRKSGISTTFVDTRDVTAVRAAIGPKTRVLYVETVSNPTLVVADLPRLAELAREHKLSLVVDNTFSPLVVTPARHGADVVVHSLTKFISGGSDHIGGAVCGTRAFISSLMDLHTGSLMLLGPTMDPRAAFDLSLRLPHLGLRMTEHSRRASVFAQRMVERGLEVRFPGLPSHPDHARLTALANPGYGHGGVLTLDAGTQGRAFALVDALQELKFGYVAVSLGYHDTLLSCSASSTSSELPPEDLERAGISESLVRMSVGYTGAVEQRWSQLQMALKRVGLL